MSSVIAGDSYQHALRIEVEGRCSIIEVSEATLENYEGGKEKLASDIRGQVQAFFDRFIRGTDLEENFTERTVETQARKFMDERLGDLQYAEYQRWMESMGLEALSESEFQRENTLGGSVMKRFRQIQRQGLLPGRSIRYRRAKKEVFNQITGVSPDCKLILNGSDKKMDPRGYIVVE